MKRIVSFLIVFTSAIFFAAIFGIIHDQITYTLSPEYYTRFKFEQFGYDYCVHTPRSGAIAIGILATWWVGIPIGLILGIISSLGKIIRRQYNMIAKLFLQLAIITLSIGFIGLLYSLLFINTGDNFSNWVPEGVINKRMFIAVGMMHNFSYLGGFLGLVYASIRLIIFKVKAK